MAKKRFSVETYKVTVGYELSVKRAGPKIRAYVVCFGADGHRFAIYFAAPGSEMKPPGYFPDDKFGLINVPIDEMPHYVDILRNEKPVYAYLDSEKPQWNCIRTSKEPVGEEET